MQVIYSSSSSSSTMASEQPLFDPSLKKRKKKNVVFIEDPLGADADPTKPAPETIDSTTIAGESVDLGPTTAHELMAQAPAAASEPDDLNSMFGDLKKKKKKKIPMDFVRGPPHRTASILMLSRFAGRRLGHLDAAHEGGRGPRRGGADHR